MNRTSFLKIITGWLSAIPIYAIFSKSKPKPKFYWVDEYSEIFAAMDVKELFHAMNDKWRSENELLTLKNKGELWDEVDSTGVVTCQETGKAWTYAQALDEWGWNTPCQISTSYT